MHGTKMVQHIVSNGTTINSISPVHQNFMPKPLPCSSILIPIEFSDPLGHFIDARTLPCFDVFRCRDSTGSAPATQDHIVQAIDIAFITDQFLVTAVTVGEKGMGVKGDIRFPCAPQHQAELEGTDLDLIPMGRMLCSFFGQGRGFWDIGTLWGGTVNCNRVPSHTRSHYEPIIEKLM